MNYLDIYKMLPRTNCGECGLPACMSFAINAFKGQIGIDRCPYVEDEKARELVSSTDTSDWREDLVESMEKEVGEKEFDEIAAGIGAQLEDGYLKVKCLGSEYRITPDGYIETESHVNIWIKILLLHYVRTAGNEQFKDDWISFGELRNGMVKATSFKRECEDPLREIADRNADQFEKMILSLGGKRIQSESADHAWMIYPLPRVPFMILYWCADSEFDSTLKILFDRSADAYLDVESYIFLGEGLVEILKRI